MSARPWKTAWTIAILGLGLPIAIVLLLRFGMPEPQTRDIRAAFYQLSKSRVLADPFILEKDASAKEIRIFQPDPKSLNSGTLVARITFADTDLRRVKSVLTPQPLTGAPDPDLAESVLTMYRWMNTKMPAQSKYQVEYFGSTITPIPARPDGKIWLNLIKESDGTFKVGWIIA